MYAVIILESQEYRHESCILWFAEVRERSGFPSEAERRKPHACACVPTCACVPMYMRHHPCSLQWRIPNHVPTVAQEPFCLIHPDTGAICSCVHSPLCGGNPWAAGPPSPGNSRKVHRVILDFRLHSSPPPRLFLSGPRFLFGDRSLYETDLKSWTISGILSSVEGSGYPFCHGKCTLPVNSFYF